MLHLPRRKIPEKLISDCETMPFIPFSISPQNNAFDAKN